MSKYLLAGAAAAAAAAATIALAPAVAQSVQPAPAPNVLIQRAPMAAKVHTRASVQQTVAQHFARLDANRDGFVTRAEAAAVKGARAGKRGDRSAMRAAGRNAGAMFDRLDTNRDGSISRAEFDARRAQRQQRVAARDATGDGRPDVRRMGGGGFGAFGGRMFDLADANRDGRVTIQEAIGAALQHFDIADSNRDGQITPDERIQMRQRMRAERRPG